MVHADILKKSPHRPLQTKHGDSDIRFFSVYMYVLQGERVHEYMCVVCVRVFLCMHVCGVCAGVSMCVCVCETHAHSKPAFLTPARVCCTLYNIFFWNSDWSWSASFFQIVV